MFSVVFKTILDKNKATKTWYIAHIHTHKDNQPLQNLEIQDLVIWRRTYGKGPL